MPETTVTTGESKDPQSSPPMMFMAYSVGGAAIVYIIKVLYCLFMHGCCC